ncbi:MAG: hypothetical protein IJX92_00825 [Clostridia bacterium]|nr:hypothetical protein [Clostridia bacterium]
MKVLPWMYNHKIIEEISPEMRYDGKESFDAWQKRAKVKLGELLGMKNIKKTDDTHFTIEYVKDAEDYTEYRFTLESEVGYVFPSVMRVPKGIEGKMPVMICLQGHSTGMHISLGKPIFPNDTATISGGDRDFVVRGVKEGFVSVAVEQRNFGECGGNAENGKPMCHVSSMSAIINGRTTIGERVHDVSCVIDALIDNFDFIDADNINLMGNSGGGTATYYAACLEERIKLAMPSCAVCTYKHSIAAMEHCVCNFIPNIANYFDMGDLAGMIAPRRLVVVNGKCDPIFPDEGVRESYEIIKRMYEAAGVPDRCALVTGEEGHRFYADAAWPVAKELMSK